MSVRRVVDGELWCTIGAEAGRRVRILSLALRRRLLAGLGTAQDLEVAIAILRTGNQNDWETARALAMTPARRDFVDLIRAQPTAHSAHQHRIQVEAFDVVCEALNVQPHESLWDAALRRRHHGYHACAWPVVRRDYSTRRARAYTVAELMLAARAAPPVRALLLLHRAAALWLSPEPGDHAAVPERVAWP